MTPYTQEVEEALKFADRAEDNVLNGYGLAAKTLAAELRRQSQELERAREALEYCQGFVSLMAYPVGHKVREKINEYRASIAQIAPEKP